MTPLATIHSCLLALAMLFLPSQVFAQTTKSSWQEDWGKSLEAARSQVENQSEEKLEKIRELAQKFAPALLKSV